MKSSVLLFLALNILFASLSTTSVLAYNAGACCRLAKAKNAFIGDVPAPQDQHCAQNYTEGSLAAAPLYVSYQFCKTECPGVGISDASQPSQWAAPIVQFLLPSVIFSMTIPRRKKSDFGYLLDFKGLRTARRIFPERRTFWRGFLNTGTRGLVYAALFVFILIPIVIDTLIWIFMIMVGAGNMIAAGLLEAHLDVRIVSYCAEGEITDEEDLRQKRELLSTVVAGNLQLTKGNPQEKIPLGLLLHSSDSSPAAVEDMFKSRLLSLLDVQVSFGGAVGSPVLFFLGAFIYTILDLEQNPSSEDAAISLAFGIEWMNIVNVAIVSGCLLACNNPSTSAGLAGVKHEALKSTHTERNLTAQRDGQFSKLTVRKWNREEWFHYILGWSDAYETDFQPVSLWDRGTNKMAWIKKSEAWIVEGLKLEGQRPFRDALHIGWRGRAFNMIFAIGLVALPPASGAVVAYYFPPRGLGCRCLSFMIYGICQALLCIISVIRNAAEVKHGPSPVGWWMLPYGALWLISFFSAVGGTTFQIVGVFRNCVCASLTHDWYNLWHNNPAINLATDTQAARNASRYWIVMGIVAAVFVGSVSYLGWWYQKLLRHEFTEAVKKLHMPRDDTPRPTTGETIDGSEGQNGFQMTDRSNPGEATGLLHKVPQSWDPARNSTGSQQPLLTGELEIPQCYIR